MVITSSVTLAWVGPSEGADQVEAYHLYTSPSQSSDPLILEPDLTSRRLTRLSPDTEYVFRLTTSSALAGESDPVEIRVRTCKFIPLMISRLSCLSLSIHLNSHLLSKRHFTWFIGESLLNLTRP